MKSEINAGCIKWQQLSDITCDPLMPLKLKGKDYKAIIKPAIMYDYKYWLLKDIGKKDNT